MIKSNSVCIYTTGRSGGNLVEALLSSRKVHTLSEIFTFSGGYSRAKFLESLAVLKQRDAIKDDKFYRLAVLCLEAEKSNSIEPFVNNKDLDAELLSLFISETGKHYRADTVMFRYMGWYDEGLKLDFKQFFPVIDTLIFLHRENALRQWLSFARAFKSNTWILFDKKKKEDVKVHWDKQEYLNFFEHKKRVTHSMFQNFKAFTGKKCFLTYEEIADEETQATVLRNKFLEANISLEVHGNFVPVKQSSERSLEKNFENEEDFLADYPSIKDKTLIN